MGRPFTHLYASEMRGDGVGFWFLQELCADQFAVIQKEQKWTGGDWFRFQDHSWGTSNPFINNAWSLVTTGVALSLEVIEDLKAADYAKVGFTEDDRAGHIAQMKTLIAYFYLRGLDFYGACRFTKVLWASIPSPAVRPRIPTCISKDCSKSRLKYCR